MSAYRVCPKCNEREGTIRWGDALAITHGGAQWWCLVCALQAQINHAEERAAALPELRERLAAALDSAPKREATPTTEGMER